MNALAGSRTAREEFSADWPLLLAAMMGVGLASVIPYSIGIFIGPIRQDFGWSSELILAAFALIGIMGIIGAPFTGQLIKRFSARTLALTGTVVIALGTATLGLIPRSVELFFACFLVIATGNTLVSAIIWQKIIVERFVKARGLAVSVALCGSNIAGSISPLLATLVIQETNWRVGYFALGAYMLLSVLPLAWFFFRETPVDVMRSKADNLTPLAGLTPRQAVRTLEFWCMSVSFMFAGMGITGYVVYLVPMLTSRGLPLLLAASVLSGLSVAALGGRLLAGALMDHVFAPRLASIALILPLASSALLLFLPPEYWVAVAAAVLVGLSTGAEFNMIAYLTTRYFGLKDYGAIGGIFYCVFMLGCLGGQQLPALLLHWWGYEQVIIVFGASFVIASTMMLACRPYPNIEGALSEDIVTTSRRAEPAAGR